MQPWTWRTILGPTELCRRWLQMVEDADRAGFPVTAEHLVFPTDQVLEGKASPLT
jgi:hypothetical protein